MISPRYVTAVVRKTGAIGLFYRARLAVLSTSWTAHAIIEDIHAQGYEVRHIESACDRD